MPINSLPFLSGVTNLLVSALRDRLRPGVDDYLDLFTVDAVVEIPWGPRGPERMTGLPAIARAMEKLRGTVVLESMVLTTRHDGRDGQIVLEYDGRVHAVSTDRHFEQSYIAVVELRDGRISRFREYSNPLPAMQAFSQ